MKPQALVTGGSRGIGRAICTELAEHGFDVAFTYYKNEQLARNLESELTAKGYRAKAYCMELSSPESIEQNMDKILADFPQLEVLVNNAAMTIDGLTMRYKLEDFNQLMNTNLRGSFLVTQAVLRPMIKSRRGSIIFMSSVAGQMGNAGQVVYSATKAALLGMTKSLAKELGSRGIRVNAVAPGFIKTDMTESLPAQTKQSILGQIPLGSFGEPVDVAKAVLFLVSSKYITGEVIAINGGLYM